MVSDAEAPVRADMELAPAPSPPPATTSWTDPVAAALVIHDAEAEGNAYDSIKVMLPTLSPVVTWIVRLPADPFELLHVRLVCDVHVEYSLALDPKRISML